MISILRICVILVLGSSIHVTAMAQTISQRNSTKTTPDINESRQYENVFHSPSATNTPVVFHSVVQLEIVLEADGQEPFVRYVNGTCVGKRGQVVSVYNSPESGNAQRLKIHEVTAIGLDGSGSAADVVKHLPEYGIIVLQLAGNDLRPLPLTDGPPVAQRKLMWYTAFTQGRKTFLYYRPLKMHKASVSPKGNVPAFLCQVIDEESSSLTAERSGSPLIGLDGTVQALMGYQPHWNVSPKQIQPRTKTALAVPAEVIHSILAK